MFAASIYFYNNIKQCTNRATMTPRLWRMMSRGGERGDKEAKQEREKEMREEPSFYRVPPSTVENVSAVNQQHC